MAMQGRVSWRVVSLLLSLYLLLIAWSRRMSWPVSQRLVCWLVVWLFGMNQFLRSLCVSWPLSLTMARFDQSAPVAIAAMVSAGVSWVFGAG